jgi:hypothetical protein
MTSAARWKQGLDISNIIKRRWIVPTSLGALAPSPCRFIGFVYLLSLTS